MERTIRQIRETEIPKTVIKIIIKIIIRAITPEMKMPEKAAILQMDGITTVWHGNIFRMDVL